jgi:acetyl-CoA carboxylase biotin carboxyl carrier protein
MPRLSPKIDELVKLMGEYGLDRARLKGEGWSVEFSRKAPSRRPTVVSGAADPAQPQPGMDDYHGPPESSPPGTPVTSPAMGVYYTSPSPGSPPFVQVGDTVSSGQTIGLIEAMKVFNEVPCPISGRVVEVVAENGQLVQSGDVLLRVGKPE